MNGAASKWTVEYEGAWHTALRVRTSTGVFYDLRCGLIIEDGTLKARPEGGIVTCVRCAGAPIWSVCWARKSAL